MPETIYDRETLDYEVVKGDSLQMRISFTDKNRTPINVTTFQMRFTVRDIVTDDVIEMISGVTTHSKDHELGSDTGRGIHYQSDTDLITLGLTINNQNEIIIFLTPDDTSLLKPTSYRFDLEILPNFGNIRKTLTGRINVLREETLNA